jgi:hypothetical protein
MRQAGIPTTAAPEARIASPVGDQYVYRIPSPGGGSRTAVVTNHAEDPLHGPHWEAGIAKPFSRDRYGRYHYYNEDPLTHARKEDAPYGDAP